LVKQCDGVGELFCVERLVSDAGAFQQSVYAVFVYGLSVLLVLARDHDRIFFWWFGWFSGCEFNFWFGVFVSFRVPGFRPRPGAWEEKSSQTWARECAIFFCGRMIKMVAEMATEFLAVCFQVMMFALTFGLALAGYAWLVTP